MEKLSCVPTAAPENGAHDRPLRQSIMYVWKNGRELQVKNQPKETLKLLTAHSASTHTKAADRVAVHICKTHHSILNLTHF